MLTKRRSRTSPFLGDPEGELIGLRIIGLRGSWNRGVVLLTLLADPEGEPIEMRMIGLRVALRPLRPDLLNQPLRLRMEGGLDHLLVGLIEYESVCGKKAPR